jgi:hypothetical protein
MTGPGFGVHRFIERGIYPGVTGKSCAKDGLIPAPGTDLPNHLFAPPKKLHRRCKCLTGGLQRMYTSIMLLLSSIATSHLIFDEEFRLGCLATIKDCNSYEGCWFIPTTSISCSFCEFTLTVQFLKPSNPLWSYIGLRPKPFFTHSIIGCLTDIKIATILQLLIGYP